MYTINIKNRNHQKLKIIKWMEPGVKSDRTGMVLMRRWEFNQILGYKTVEVLDIETKRLIGESNFRKIDIETRK